MPWRLPGRGGGFVYISAGGDLEACPFAPYSDSKLLAAIREQSPRLKREAIETLLAR
jgi:hypothetical protein